MVQGYEKHLQYWHYSIISSFIANLFLLHCLDTNDNFLTQGCATRCAFVCRVRFAKSCESQWQPLVNKRHILRNKQCPCSQSLWKCIIPGFNFDQIWRYINYLFWGYQLVAKIRSFINYAWDLDAIFQIFLSRIVNASSKIASQISSGKKDTEFKIFYYVKKTWVLL